jgi:hypothetical protein
MNWADLLAHKALPMTSKATPAPYFDFAIDQADNGAVAVRLQGEAAWLCQEHMTLATSSKLLFTKAHDAFL